MVIMADTATGKICGLRQISANTFFTKSLFKMVTNLQEQPFNERQYNEDIYKLYSRYNSKQLADMSRVYCKIS